jgi:hypothetical protein
MKGAPMSDTRSREREAIEHGYAEYNSQTGVWQWKERVER